ncbi:MAG: DNA-formamidopyrimidine glycosylase [Candidatus Staskawiczbacteria bacterium RIFCSPLOWO2_01_FULL_40_39]|uniref:DNA-formamidopyrimidine glycosylase n=1 Tax=Candidatus Staskawiczbacteria bacterium RIFCSPHIGHO2_01_FULL_39_25 TaxID=1802202 RepID=A0A1G2HMT8_9BACT|nr:MAG: DNA-formamidopyrimidine glycosylase [Candidatus Staskawiczbacteria bacterium RIFCSPHIGHO2_01_FULL_39_25]OGZ73202.1 MAG: DNA-formamidopyrimidine glycosylase [Candidatus Staskawiczbacteria bacterium RIFCSPLOWO2_01_FULL_40_39]
MPELPEVETTVKGLIKLKVLNRTFINAWSDWKKVVRLRSNFIGATARQVKTPKDFELFKKELKGKKIKKIWRRAKNIIFELSGGYSLLIHQKMTGHLLYGTWNMKHGTWESVKKGPLEEKINLFIHLLFTLDNGKMIALSDYRKFAKAELWKTEELLNSPEFKNLGPEPLEKSFTFAVFKKALQGKRGKVKQVIMVPEVIAGIGNIYSSEALWWAKIHPQKDVSKLNEKELKLLYGAIKKVLLTGVVLGGESFADYRNIEGEKGHFDDERKVYKREKQPCFRCEESIVRLKFGGRSAFFCPKCQRL